MTRKLQPLHEEEDLTKRVTQAYNLAINSFEQNTPINKKHIQNIYDFVKNHMEESIIMSLGKNTPHNSNSVDDAITNFLKHRDIYRNLVSHRYQRQIYEGQLARELSRRGGKRGGKRRATRRHRKRA